MAFPIEVCKERLQIWLDAEAAIATGQSYTIDNRRLDRANLSQVQQQIRFWQRELVKAESSGKGKRRVTRIVPRDL